MNRTINPARTYGVLWVKRDVVKHTALLYLREALLAEEYENCAEFAATAKEFGAKDFEIKLLLEDPRRLPKG